MGALFRPFGARRWRFTAAALPGGLVEKGIAEFISETTGTDFSRFKKGHSNIHRESMKGNKATRKRNVFLVHTRKITLGHVSRESTAHGFRFPINHIEKIL